MTLDEKLKKITELGQVISISSERVLSQATREAVENEQFRLEFALKNLLDEVRSREADLKIASMEKVVALLKQT